MSEPEPEPWRVESSRSTYRDRWISVRSDRCVRADGRVIEPFHVLEYPDWLNVVAVTRRGDLVLVREYRHGAGAVLTALPAGTFNPAEAPEQAARRELREETGYTGGRFLPMARSFANPANQTNTVHPFLALGVEPTDAPSPDDSEEIRVILSSYLDTIARLWRGEVSIQVSHVAALHQSAHAILSDPSADLDFLREGLRDLFRTRHGPGPVAPTS